jgi:PHD/YefM family antitoxin component YafN of YafNO toxin-antitoxin module
MGIKTLTISQLRGNLADSLDSISHDEILIVTRRGKKESAIIDLDRLEDLLAVTNPEYLKTIHQARESKDYFSHDEVFGDI